MKALSLRQPWAWLVVHGGKGIENRRWNTRFRGSFLIHAAVGMTRVEYAEALAFARDVDPSLVVPPRAELLFGGIVGRAELVDVIAPCGPLGISGPLVECRCGHPWHMPEQFGFVLGDVEPLPFEPLRGSLGFFDVAKARLPKEHRRGT